MFVARLTKLLPIILVAFAVTGASVGLSGPARSEAVSDERLRAAKEVLQATGAAQQFDAIMPLMLKQINQSIVASNPKLSEPLQAMFNDIVKAFSGRKQELLDKVAALYAKNFTVEEMTALTEFYRTDVGRKFVAAQPQLATESMKLGQEWGRTVGQQIMEQIKAKLIEGGHKL